MRNFIPLSSDPQSDHNRGEMTNDSKILMPKSLIFVLHFKISNTVLEDNLNKNVIIVVKIYFKKSCYYLKVEEKINRFM